MKKYKPLHTVLQQLPAGIVEVKLTFAGIEEILGAALPPSARSHRAWWANPRNANQHPYAQAWLSAGWEVDAVDQAAGWVVFRRADQAAVRQPCCRTPREPVTRQDMDQLLRFLPLFDDPDFQPVEAWAGGEKTPDGAITMLYPVYAPEVVEFFQLAGQPCWSDYDYDTITAGQMVQHDARITGATLDEIKSMLTYCVRGERFYDGHWEEMLESGRITALLQRLAALRMAHDEG
ncbi:MAG: hypothetical protein JXM73_06855 [Anaerolineae bacterium]|nr:hypothetical protein [Anaerolineae bacterium]